MTALDRSSRSLAVCLLFASGVALVPNTAGAQCAAPGPIQTLADGAGFVWDISTNGQVAGGTSNAFDDGFALRVNGAYFPAATRSVELNGRQLVHGPVQMSQLEVTRRVFVPFSLTAPGGAFARFMEYFRNPTDRGVSVTVRLETNVGSNALTRVTGTSDGDATYDLGDRWVATSDGRGQPRPQAIFNYWGPSAALSPSSIGLSVYDCNGSEGTFAEFNLFVPAHTTRILMHFGTQLVQDISPGRAAVLIDNATARNMLDGVSRRDLLRIANWGFSSTRLFTFAQQRLYQVQTTGQGDVLAPVPMISNGAAFSPDAVLYAITNPGPGARLATVDLETGQEAPIGPVWNLTNVLAMEASSSGQLYAAGLDGSLYRVDRATGVPALFGNVGLPIVELAFEPARDTLWALVIQNGVHSLYRIDINTRTATFVTMISGLPAGHTFVSLSIAQDGTFYLIDNAQIRQTAFLYRLDPNIGRTLVVNPQFPLSQGIVSGDFFIHSPPICGNGIVEANEQCDNGATNGAAGDCCSARCTFQTAAVVCRPSAGACDPAETCTGRSGQCPADALTPASTVCRAATGDCEDAARCTGTGPQCPANPPLPTTTVCRPAAGPCDVAEYCTGLAAQCPLDQFVASTIACRSATGVCGTNTTCNGSGPQCPPERFLPSTTVCHATAGVCDLQQNCTGTQSACPPRRHRTDQCRPASGQCDSPARCDGVRDECPPNPPRPNGTPCSDGLVCNGTETCIGGVCRATMPLDCRTGNPCRRESCVEPTGCQSIPIPGCCNTSVDCNDGNACHRGVCSGPGGTCRFDLIPGCCNRNPDCDDGNICNVNTCSGPGGTCTHSPISGCCRADGDCPRTGVCSRDSCNVATHRCVSTPVAGCCSADRDCDDSNPCTTDACTVATGVCTHTQIADCCRTRGDCDSHNVCTADTCPAPGAQCQHAPIAGCCTQSSECTPSGVCSTASCNLMTNRCASSPIAGCCMADGDCRSTSVCLAASCNTATHTCMTRPIAECCNLDSECDDMNGCTVDQCSGHMCVHTHVPERCPDAGLDAGAPDANAADASPPVDAVALDAPAEPDATVGDLGSEDAGAADLAPADYGVVLRDLGPSIDATPQPEETKKTGCDCGVTERPDPGARGGAGVLVAWAIVAVLAGARFIRRGRRSRSPDTENGPRLAADRPDVGGR